jgi:serine/threonine protein kinase
LDEKIDVWSLGNNFYTLLVGLFPYYHEMHSDGVKTLVKKGEVWPYISDTFRYGSPGEKELVDIIEETWTFNPQDRIDVFAIIQRLRQVIEAQQLFEHESNTTTKDDQHP